MNGYSAAEWQEILKKTQESYKYTQLTDKFIYKVFGQDNFSVRLAKEHVKSMQQWTISPTKEFKAFLQVGYEPYILANDFDITTLDGFIEPRLTKQWRDGMVKRALPLKDREHKIDVEHYLLSLYNHGLVELHNSISCLKLLEAIRKESDQD